MAKKSATICNFVFERVVENELCGRILHFNSPRKLNKYIYTQSKCNAMAATMVLQTREREKKQHCHFHT